MSIHVRTISSFCTRNGIEERIPSILAQLYLLQTNFEFDIERKFRFLSFWMTENRRCANFSGVHFDPRNNETSNVEGRDARSEN